VAILDQHQVSALFCFAHIGPAPADAGGGLGSDSFSYLHTSTIKAERGAYNRRWFPK